MAWLHGHTLLQEILGTIVELYAEEENMGINEC
jgi:hypothetical protein